jgi:hypothetical protein
MTVRIPRLPLWPMMAGGAVTGFVGGLFVGGVIGALLTWFSGAVLDWHRQLGFTLGVTEELLPLGEQIGVLQTIRDLWWLVVPAAGLVVGLLNGLIGFLAGGLMVALFNRLAHSIELEVEVTATVAGPDGPAGEPRLAPTSSRRARM